VERKKPGHARRCARKDLPGSQHAPELGRSLTFNVYAREVRHYKKRNLPGSRTQGRRVHAPASGSLRRRHARARSVLESVFWRETQWYDYNPGTLKQFRHWLAGSGPYAGVTEPDVPDLSSYRRRKPLTLGEASKLAKREFRTWNDVDPPRAFPRDAAHPFWLDPWVREWEMFRRHLVNLHYDELSQWLTEVGVPRDRIWSAQGFMAPAGNAMPFALAIDSPVKNYDSAACPSQAQNRNTVIWARSSTAPPRSTDVPMENNRSLFATLSAVDPGFAIVEYNTADLRAPEVPPTYAAALSIVARPVERRRAVHFADGLERQQRHVRRQTGYVTFTAWRNTPLEDAAYDFLPLARACPFGREALDVRYAAPRRRRRVDRGSRIDRNRTRHAALEHRRDGSRCDHLAARAFDHTPNASAKSSWACPHDKVIRSVSVYARGSPNSNWQLLTADRGQTIANSAAGRLVATRARLAAPADQLKIEIVFDQPMRDVTLTRIAVLAGR
jgi:hypothetical protein